MPTRKAFGIELLADPTRRRIVGLLSSSLRRPSDLASILGLSRPATSRQLRLLTEAGLLRWQGSNIDGRTRLYTVNPPMRAPIIAWLAGVDLRNARPVFERSWSPPARSHRLRGDTADLGLDHDGFA